MKGSKRLLALGLAGLMALSTAGCGNSSKTEETKGADTSAAGTAAAGTTEGSTTTGAKDGSGEEITLKITWWGGQNRHEYTQKLLDKYTELHPNIKFEAMPSGWEGYIDKLATQAAAGAMPDIVQMDYMFITTYAKNNSIADLTPFVEDGTIDVSDVDENLYQSGIIDGKLAGLVLANSILTTGYNPDVLAEAGIETPSKDWTWNDFVEMCTTVKEKTDKYGSSVGPVDDTNLFHYWVRQHGVSLFSEDKKSLGYEDDQICVDYLNMWSDLMAKGAAPNPDEYAAIQTLGQEAGPVVTGDGATTFDWNNYSNRMSGVNDKLKIMTPPLGNDGADKGLWNKPSQFFSVADTSRHKKEAAEFINWFINSEEANDIILGERGTPVSSKIREYLKSSGKLNEQQIDMFDYVDAALPLCGETPDPDPIGMSEVNEAFKNAAYSAFYGQSTAEEAAKTFREEANAILARNN